jgi:hypothetical protein
MPDEPAATPTPTAPPADPAPAPTAPPATPPAPADPATGDAPTDDDAPPDDEFTSDRQRRRFAAISGKVTQFARERDEARARLVATQWREVERLAGALAVPSDIRLEAPELTALLDETGDVDPESVAAAVRTIISARPGLARITPAMPLGGIHRLPPAPTKPTFAEKMQELTRGRV